MKLNKKFFVIVIGIICTFLISYALVKGTYSTSVNNNVFFEPTISVDEENMIIQYLEKGTTVSSLLSQIYTDVNNEILIYNKSGNKKVSNDILATGDKFILNDSGGNKILEYTLSILGDVNGDGAVNNDDVLKLFKFYRGEIELEHVCYVKAGNVKYKYLDNEYVSYKTINMDVGEIKKVTNTETENSQYLSLSSLNYVTLPDTKDMTITLADVAKLSHHLGDPITDISSYSLVDLQFVSETPKIESSDANILTVDSYNNITAKSDGNVMLSVTTGGKKIKIYISTRKKNVYPEEITFSEDNKILNKGAIILGTSIIKFSPDNTTERSLTWTSSDESVVKVNENGEIAAVNGGSATVTATTVNGKKASIIVMVDAGKLELLKDTKFNNGFELWLDATEKSYMCANCKDEQYWYIATWDFPPKFVNLYDNNGYHYIDAEYQPDTNNKLVAYNNDGEMHLAMNTFGLQYSDSEASGWPHLLLGGKENSKNCITNYYSLNKLEQKYYTFFNNDIWYHVDVKLDLYNKGKPINGISAAQYLSYLMIRDKQTMKYVWFGFNLFDDRKVNQGNYSNLDLHTNSYIYSLGTDTIYNGMNNSIYNNGNFVYNEWRSVDVNVSNYIDDIIKLANEKQFFGRNITEDDLFIGGFNIGYEIHGEYHIGMSMKNLQVTSVAR